MNRHPSRRLSPAFSLAAYAALLLVLMLCGAACNLSFKTTMLTTSTTEPSAVQSDAQAAERIKPTATTTPLPILITAKARGSYSDNWSGYVVTTKSTRVETGAVTEVSAQWVIPKVVCGQGEDTASAVWVGIDGSTDKTVEQLGTEQDCVKGKPTYYTWYEIYPKPARSIATLDVGAGDTISADVSYTGNNQFILTLKNVMTGESFTVNRLVPTARRRSAEWIVEAPFSKVILPLANFGTVQFTKSSATLRGHKGTIMDPLFSHEALVMATEKDDIKAQTYVPTKMGDTFAVTWLSQ